MSTHSLLLVLVSAACCCLTCDVRGQEKEPRLWRDSTGNFQVRAALIEQNATAVRLQTVDGRVISVPVHRLSQSDQDYLKSLNAPADNPFGGGSAAPGRANAQAAALPGTLRARPESKSVGEVMALPATGNTLDLSADALDTAFVPDPEPTVPAIPVAAVPISAVDPYDKVAAPVLASSEEGRFLVSIARTKPGSPQETRGRVYSVSLTREKSDVVWDAPNAVRVLDHDRSSGHTLLVDKLDPLQRGGELAVVQGLETGNVATLYRRTLPGAGKPGFAPQVEWARFLSPGHVAAIVDRALYVWDLPAAQLVYRVEPASAAEPPVFSGNQLYTAIPQGGRVVIVETATGAIRTSISTGSTLTPGAAFDPTGRLLAVCFSNQYQVWDCAASKIVNEATTTEQLGSHPIHWIAPKLFRAASGDIVHLELGMSVWKYVSPSSAGPLVLGDKLLAATASPECVLACAKIPHSSAEASIERLMKAGAAAMIVQPGSMVAIAIETTESVDHAAIKKSLTEAAEKAGWKVSDRAPIALVAKIGRGKTEQLQFRSMGRGPRTTSTASLTPFTADLEIRSGASVLWTRSTMNRIPRLLHLQEGETTQDAVKRFEKPDAAFFSHLTLPPRIPKPEIAAQVGQSVLKNGQWQDVKISARTPRSK